MTTLTSKYIQSVGRRKLATAQVRLHASGTGQVFVNGTTLEIYFPMALYQDIVKSPLKAVGAESGFDIGAKVVGGGKRGQADGIRLGIARALILHNPEWRTTLKKLGYLTRDPRVRERKKFGKKSARRSPQWSKR